jgi:2-desacetyl-2-hydroxyethyl bacteriochlorophyllide A dehydrogenase
MAAMIAQRARLLYARAVVVGERGDPIARSLVLEGPRSLSLKEEPAHDLCPRDIRVRALLSGISHGTELSLYRGSSAFHDYYFDWDLRAFVRPDPPRPAYPATLGYEMVGVVEEAGAAVSEVVAGDLVHVGMPHREETMVDVDAALRATYPLVRLPTSTPSTRWLFVSLGMVALVALHDARVKLGDHVAVMGLGAIGLLVVQLARLAGVASVTAVDPVESRRELAREFGAAQVLDPADVAGGIGPAIKRLGGRGVDVAIETSGSTSALQDAISATGLGGTVVTVGFYQGGAPELRLGQEWHHNRLEMVSSMGAWGAPHRSHPAWDRLRIARTVVGLLSSDQLSVDALPIKYFPFEEAVDAYDWLDEHPDEAIKVALTYGGE